MTAFVEVTRRGKVIEVALNRPEKKNAITLAMYEAMAEALRTADADDAIRCVVITAAGDTFTSGNDLKDFVETPPRDDTAPVNRFLDALAGCEKVLVAAVNGPAVGIGTTMLLHCDLVLAARIATFQLPFVKLALVPEAASSLLLAQVVGRPRALEMLLLGDAIDAETALRYGLLNRVVEPGELMEAARALADRVAAQAPTALRLTKRLTKSDALTVRARMDEESGVFRARLASPELREAVQAFYEKRPPDFERIGV